MEVHHGKKKIDFTVLIKTGRLYSEIIDRYFKIIFHND